MAVKIPFITTVDFEYGQLEQQTPLIRRIVCNNPSHFTFNGSGTFVIGNGKVAVIDPGPADENHIDALLKSLDAAEFPHSCPHGRPVARVITYPELEKMFGRT